MLSVNSTCEPLDAIVELDQRKFVSRIRGAQQLCDSFPGAPEFWTHASAGVEDNHDRHRRVLGHEVGDRLYHAVVVDSELLSREAGHLTIANVYDVYRNEDKIGIDAEGRGGAIACWSGP